MHRLALHSYRKFESDPIFPTPLFLVPEIRV